MKRFGLLGALVGALVLAAAPAATAISGTQYQWRVHRVSKSYHTYGRWITCAQGGAGATISCSHGITVANTVSGQVGVSDGVLSASVGFSVTKSTTLTGGASYHVPRHHVWQVQYQPVFNTKAVHQRLYERKWGCGRASCGHTPWRATNRYETAYASGFAFANFRHVQVR